MFSPVYTYWVPSLLSWRCTAVIRWLESHTVLQHFFLWSRNDEEGLRLELWIQVSILPNVPAYRVAISERCTSHVLLCPCWEQANIVKVINLQLQAFPLAAVGLWMQHTSCIQGFWAFGIWLFFSLTKWMSVDWEQFIFSSIRNCSCGTESVTSHWPAATALQVKFVWNCNEHRSR